MLSTILSLYTQSILITTGLVLFMSLCWLIQRAFKRVDKTSQERQRFLYDVILITLMTIPILSFGVVGILLIVKA